MQNLKTDTISIDGTGIHRQYQVKERDHGDLVVYDVFFEDDYLLTLTRNGDILFMNFNATESRIGANRDHRFLAVRLVTSLPA